MFAVDSSGSVDNCPPFKYTLLFYTLLPTSLRAPLSCRPSRRTLTSAIAAPPGDMSTIGNCCISYLEVATNQKRPDLFVFVSTLVLSAEKVSVIPKQKA